MSPLATLARWFRASDTTEQAARLYIALVEQSRNPFFYRELAVPDTLDGRFDMVILHVSLLLIRLQAAQENALTRIGQEVIESLLADMDRNLREMGVGDMGIGRRVQKMGNAFYGRLRSYEAALSTDDAALGEALARNAYRGEPVEAAALQGMVNYTRASHAGLAAMPAESLLTEPLHFAPLPA